jgi:hypothetical protein
MAGNPQSTTGRDIAQLSLSIIYSVAVLHCLHSPHKTHNIQAIGLPVKCDCSLEWQDAKLEFATQAHHDASLTVKDWMAVRFPTSQRVTPLSSLHHFPFITSTPPTHHFITYLSSLHHLPLITSSLYHFLLITSSLPSHHFNTALSSLHHFPLVTSSLPYRHFPIVTSLSSLPYHHFIASLSSVPSHYFPHITSDGPILTDRPGETTLTIMELCTATDLWVCTT